MESLEITIAETLSDIEEAARLIHQEYARQGYLEPSLPPTETKFFRFLFLPSSRTFVARGEGKVLGTISVITDSGYGLPMDELYHEELNYLRSSGKRIAEVSQLAIAGGFGARKGKGGFISRLKLLIPLFSAVFRFSRSKKIDTLCIAVNPKHAPFYNLLSFQDLGGLKYYPAVNQAPAVAKMIHLEDVIGKAQGHPLLRCIIEDHFEL